MYKNTRISNNATILLSCSRNSQHFTEPEGSLPCSKGPPLVPVLSQTIPVPSLSSYCFRIHFNIILQPATVSSKLSLSFSFSCKNRVCIYLVPLTCHVTFILLTLKNSLSASQKTHWISVRETHQLGLFREIIGLNLLTCWCDTHKYTVRAVFRYNLASTGLWSCVFLSVLDQWTPFCDAVGNLSVVNYFVLQPAAPLYLGFLTVM